MLERQRHETLRRRAAAVAAVAAVPYLLLKLHWVAGGRFGLGDAPVPPGFDALNLLTVGMMLVAVGLAAVFASRRGLRIPAALVLGPMWVGTGLLGAIVVALPAAATAAAVAGEPLVATTPEQVVEPWVYGLVYGGFAVQGVALLAAFWAYAAERWPAALGGRTRPRTDGSAALQAVLDPLTAVTVVGAVALAAVSLAWGLGAPQGLSPQELEARGAAAQAVDVVEAGLILAAPAGLLLLRGLGASRPRWLATVLAWCGTGVLFGSGMWATLVLVVGGGAGAAGGDLTGVVAVVRLGTGIAMGITMLLALVEQTATDHEPTSVTSDTAARY